MLGWSCEIPKYWGPRRFGDVWEAQVLFAVLGEREVAQGIKEVHVIHEVPKEPSLNAQWRRC